MTKEYEVTFTVELDRPFEPDRGIFSEDNNLVASSSEYGALFIPDTATITELAPKFEPGYFIDMSLSDELRVGCGPRMVKWQDNSRHLEGWVRVDVHDRTF